MIRLSHVVLRIYLTLLFWFFTIVSFSQETYPKNSLNLLRIGKKNISAEEFIYLYKKNHQDTVNDYTAEKIHEYLDLFTNFKLKVEEARRRGLDTTRTFVTEYEGYREELRKPYLPDTNVIDSMVALTYRRMQEEIKASHILVSLKPDASPADTLKAYNKIISLRDKVLSGADFSELAREHSDDPSARSNSGMLGYFSALQMVYPFETAAYTTPKGSVSPPVRTKFGYHLVKVEDRRPARGEVEVSHIMLRNEGDPEKVKNTIFNIHDQLQAGVDWNELCKEFSQDPTTKDNGGKLRPFRSGAMAAVPEFEQMAFNLQKPGEISDPFQTQFGWHIMRLERKILIPSYEQIAPTLRTRVARDERTEISTKNLHQRLRKRFNYEENTALKESLISRADSSVFRGKWNPSLSQTERKSILFSLGSTQITADEFVRFLNTNRNPSPASSAKQFLEQQYQTFVDKRVAELQEKDIITKHPEYKYLLQEYYEGILLFDIMEKEVWNKASHDSAGQRSFYNSHINDYKTGERAKAAIYSSDSPQLLASLKQMIQDSTLTKAEDFISKNRIKTETGIYQKEKKHVLGLVPWQEGLHSADNEGIYYLAWLKRILPAGPMSFEEARPSVISDYQSFLEKNWVAELKRKYRVKINEKAKRYVLQTLQGP